MSPPRSLFVLLFTSAVALACGDDSGGDADDSDDGTQESAAGGGAGSGGGGSDTDLDESALASDLSVEQVEELCTMLDEAAGLLGDVERACQVEAWLATFDQGECEQIVMLCNDAGATMLELELPSGCAEQGQELPGCDVTVAEMIACAEEYGDFWAARTCDMEGLTDPGPGCDEELAMRCPVLYGDGTDGGSGSSGSGTGSCGGIAPSCALQSSSGLCIAVDGCVWLSSSETCSGVARSCDSFMSQATCIGQNGCVWTP